MFDARRYTIDSLIKQLLLLELHIRDGTVYECGCSWDAHLPLIEGLSEEGVKFAMSEKEKEFFDRLMHLSRDARLKLQYGIEGEEEGMQIEGEQHSSNPEVKYEHERVRSPEECEPSSFRTVVRNEHRVVICCPKGEYDHELEVCKVGTIAQSILHPIGEEKKELKESE